MYKARQIAWQFDGACIRITSHLPNPRGYTEVGRRGRNILVAREIAKRFKGLIDGMVTRHTCDNRWFVNPDHILAGSHADNVKDRVVRGRSAKGITNGAFKHGLHGTKEYWRECARRFRALNPAKVAAAKRKYYEANREKILIQKREQYAKKYNNSSLR